MAVDERDQHQMEIFRTGTYEPEVWEAIANHLTQNDVFWDVGAFIGSMAVHALNDRRVQEVHAFEPNPLRHSVLRFNLELNGPQGYLHDVALSDRNECRQLFNHPPPLEGGASLTQDFGLSGHTVRCRTMDTVVFEDGVQAPTVMKIDVEGWEFPLLDGGRRVFTERPPRAVVFEASSDPSGRMEDPRLSELFNQHGYGIEWLKRHDGKVWHRENYLAVPRSNS